MGVFESALTSRSKTPLYSFAPFWFVVSCVGPSSAASHDDELFYISFLLTRDLPCLLCESRKSWQSWERQYFLLVNDSISLFTMSIFATSPSFTDCILSSALVFSIGAYFSPRSIEMSTPSNLACLIASKYSRYKATFTAILARSQSIFIFRFNCFVMYFISLIGRSITIVEYSVANSAFERC
jgi:hypothetical protein